MSQVHQLKFCSETLHIVYHIELLSATSFLNRFLITVQGEEDKTIQDVRKIFASLHEMELAHVANHVEEKDYISSDHFEAYLVSSCYNFVIKSALFYRLIFSQ